MHLDLTAEIDRETDAVVLTIGPIPRAVLPEVLSRLCEEELIQNVIDGINGQLAAGDIGIAETRRIFKSRPK